MSFVLKPVADDSSSGITLVGGANAWRVTDEGVEVHDSDATHVQFDGQNSFTAVVLDNPAAPGDSGLKLSVWLALRYSGPDPFVVFSDPVLGPITFPVLKVELLLDGSRLVNIGNLSANTATHSIRTVFVANDFATLEWTDIILKLTRLDSIAANDILVTAAEFRANSPSGRATAALVGSSPGSTVLPAGPRAYPLFGR